MSAIARARGPLVSMTPATSTRAHHHRNPRHIGLFFPDRRPDWAPSVPPLFEKPLSLLKNRFCGECVGSKGLANRPNRYLLLTPLFQQTEQTIHPCQGLFRCAVPPGLSPFGDAYPALTCWASAVSSLAGLEEPQSGSTAIAPDVSPG